jgi:hypothetical protein
MTSLKPETIEFLKRRRRIGIAPRGPAAYGVHGGRTSGHQRSLGRARLFVKANDDIHQNVRASVYGRTYIEALYAGTHIEKRSKPLIIGLTGPSGAGKTEIVKHLLDKHGFTSYHVGWPVKRALRDGFRLNTKDVDGSQKNASIPSLGGVEPKLVLDHMGEAIARTAPLATALALGKKIDKLRRKGHNMIVVDGVRQQPEADFIHRRAGIMVRVDDGRGPDPTYPMDKRAWKIPVDHHIDTSGSLEATKGQVDKLMAECKLSHPAFENFKKDGDMDVGDVHIPTAIGNEAPPRRRRKYPVLSLARDPNAEPKPS